MRHRTSGVESGSAALSQLVDFVGFTLCQSSSVNRVRSWRLNSLSLALDLELGALGGVHGGIGVNCQGFRIFTLMGVHGITDAGGN